MRAALLAAPLALAACAGPAEVPAPTLEELGVLSMDPYSDPAYPFPLGTVRATLDGAPVEWTTADYSVGAVDPSARISTFEAPHEVHLSGVREAFRRDPPDRELGDIVIEGLTTDPPAPGALVEPRVEIRPGDRADAMPLLTSRGQAAAVVIETLDPGDGNARYGRATGRFRATLCRAAGPEAPPDPSDCRALEGIFDTRLYVGG